MAGKNKAIGYFEKAWNEASNAKTSGRPVYYERTSDGYLLSDSYLAVPVAEYEAWRLPWLARMEVGECRIMRCGQDTRKDDGMITALIASYQSSGEPIALTNRVYDLGHSLDVRVFSKQNGNSVLINRSYTALLADTYDNLAEHVYQLTTGPIMARDKAGTFLAMWMPLVPQRTATGESAQKLPEAA